VRCLPAHISPSRPEPAQGLVQAGARTLSEVFATTSTDGGVLGFVMSVIPKAAASILWVQDHMSQVETGRPYLPGLMISRSVIHITLPRAADVLWAMEEGLRCTSLAAVIGEVWGAPPVLDFTATKRLATRAEAGNLPCWLVRRGAVPDLSAARNRWRVASLPSQAHPHDAQAPGDPRWQVDLFRSRQAPPGTWVACYDRAADRVDFSAAFRDGPLADGDGAAEQRAAG
jgi:protein ImuA